MKTKLIQTQDYLLLIDEEVTICRGQYSFYNDKVELIHEGYNYPYKGQKVIAYYPLTKEAKELDLPLLPNPFEEDIEKLSDESFDNMGFHSTVTKEEEKQFKLGYYLGYKEAQSKQFSLDDMLRLAELLYSNRKKLENREVSIYDIIQSLSTQQLPKEFVISDKFDTFEGNIKHGEYKY